MVRAETRLAAILRGRRFFCSGTDVEADGGYVSVRPSTTGLLAVEPDRRKSRRGAASGAISANHAIAGKAAAAGVLRCQRDHYDARSTSGRRDAFDGAVFAGGAS